MLSTAPRKVEHPNPNPTSINHRRTMHFIYFLPNFRTLAVSCDFFFPANSQTKSIKGPHSDSPIHQTIFPLGREQAEPLPPRTEKVPELPPWPRRISSGRKCCNSEILLDCSCSQEVCKVTSKPSILHWGI
ncbi:hypothetical protein CEXT_632691 [Caerostris extrusa]|uniref:Uncharacterized protein n=1 Tax=Caerostris extrusa TaxID=172846 RepID=A0AAV4MGJ3_CAEEX|nr:hypothetical protein CEXT_632691 [Caerostris extrusa]